jgi:hypothetical protein
MRDWSVHTPYSEPGGHRLLLQQHPDQVDGMSAAAMSTADQILSSDLHGEALFMARRPELRPLIDHLREQAQGRDDIRTECAGVISGSWFAKPARRGEDLIAAGLLMLTGHVDLDELDHWLRVGGSVRAERQCRIPTATMAPNRFADGS